MKNQTLLLGTAIVLIAGAVSHLVLAGPDGRSPERVADRESSVGGGAVSGGSAVAPRLGRPGPLAGPPLARAVPEERLAVAGDPASEGAAGAPEEHAEPEDVFPPRLAQAFPGGEEAALAWARTHGLDRDAVEAVGRILEEDLTARRALEIERRELLESLDRALAENEIERVQSEHARLRTARAEVIRRRDDALQARLAQACYEDLDRTAGSRLGR